MDDYTVEGAHCPWCGAAADGAVPAEASRGRGPRPGDFSICYSCEGVSVYDGEPLDLRRPTPAEEQVVSASPIAARAMRVLHEGKAEGHA